MTKKMSKTSIAKKIKKILHKFHIFDEDIIRVIKKEFGDINFSYDGNTLLHLFAKEVKGGLDIIHFRDIVNTLVSQGIDINSRNNLGQNYLQVLCENAPLEEVRDYFSIYSLAARKFNVNQKDNNGKNIMDTILCNKSIYNYDNIIQLPELFELLLEEGYKDITFGEKSTVNIFDWMEANKKLLIESIVTEGYSNLFAEQRINDIISRMRSIYYETNVSEFVKLLTDDKVKNLKILSFIFCYKLSNGGTLDELGLLNKLQIEENISNEEKLKATKCLFELGCDPNYDYAGTGDSFIGDVIDNEVDIDHIIKITQLALQYGFDLNRMDIVMPITDMLNVEKKIDDIVKMYVFLCKYSYSSLEEDIIEADGCYTVDDEEIDVKDLISRIRIDGFKIMFSEQFSKSNLVFENNLLEDEEFIKLFFDIVDCSKIMLKLRNDYELIQELTKKICEERSNSTNYINDTVSKLEIIEKLRIITISITNEKFNSLIKMKIKK